MSLAPSLLIDIGIIIIVATIIGYLTKLLKQPFIPAYIITGILIGPLALGLIKDIEIIKVISEFGIAFLLFLVGMEISLNKIKNVGLVSIIGALIQMVTLFVVSYYLSLYLGFPQFEAFIVGVVMAFSSTMIVVQLLSTSDKLETLNGRIALGFLLMQDVVVILLLTMMSSLEEISPYLISFALVKGLILIGIGILLARFVFPTVFKFAAKSQELLFLSSLTILFLFALLSVYFEYSIAIGSFIAGLSLANLPYSTDIVGKVKPLKEFFATIFFVALGMQLILPNSNFIVKATLIFLAVALFLKPLIIFLITFFFGYGRRVAFLTGTSLAQTSEFSLILVALPFVLNKISIELFSMVIFVTLLTMALSAYWIKYDESLYLFFSPVLALFDKIPIKGKKMEYEARGVKKEILLIGIHRIGSIFYKTLSRLNKRVIVVDHNPDTIKELIKQKVSCMYGDMANREVLDKLEVKDLKFIISTVSNEDENIFLINYAKLLNPKVKVIVTANYVHEAFRLYNYGADYVILPHVLSGERMSSLLRDVLNGKKGLDNIRETHIKHISSLGLFKK